jgi:hypothetical protein
LVPRKLTTAKDGPSELDRLDPSPAAEAQPPDLAPLSKPRPKRRQIGALERAVREDLKRLPEDLARGGIAAAALRLATELDAGLVIGRDAASHAREMRQCLTQLRDWAPGASSEDKTDEVRARREARMRRGSPAG